MSFGVENLLLGGYVVLRGDSSEVKSGQKVVAIGAPLGLDNTVSEGVISNVERLLGKRKLICLRSRRAAGVERQSHILGNHVISESCRRAGIAWIGQKKPAWAVLVGVCTQT